MQAAVIEGLKRSISFLSSPGLGLEDMLKILGEKWHILDGLEGHICHIVK